MKKNIDAVVVIALACGFLGYTKSGRQLLKAMGFAPACSDGCSS